MHSQHPLELLEADVTRMSEVVTGEEVVARDETKIVVGETNMDVKTLRSVEDLSVVPRAKCSRSGHFDVETAFQS